MDSDLKRKKIESFTDEVKEFHPLLSSIFPKLIEIKNVNYTHGPTERGADFVLTKFDQTLEDTIYIGIVAKIGKIHSDLTEIEKQIKECSLDRFDSTGKKKIIISEIWVVTNSSITEGAKERIHKNYQEKNVQFIDYQKLIHWIDKHLPNYWFKFALEVGEYLNDIWAKNEELDRQLNLIRSLDKNIYIEQEIYEKDFGYKKTETKPKKRKSIKIIEEIKNKKIILIEGGMGSGKSKIIRWLISHFAQGQIFVNEKFLPLSVGYKDFVDIFKNDPNLVIEDRVKKSVRMKLERDVKYLLFIDGVDEKNLSSEERRQVLEKTIENIDNLNNCHALITSRRILDLKENKAITSKANVYEMENLSTEKILQFLNVFCDRMNISKRVVEDIKKSALFKALPRSPIAAILLANLLNENSKDLPSNLTELYSKYLELMLGRWDVEKGLQSQKEYEASNNILMIMSQFFIENSITYISKEEAKGFFNAYLLERNMDLSGDQLFEKVIERSGILIRDPFKNYVYFKHKTFLEYFYAKLMLKDKNLKVDDRAFNIYWDNIYFFYIGLQKDCAPFIQEIANLKPNGEGQRWHKMINMSNYFLAGDNSPYKVVTDNLFKIFSESADLYLDIADRKLDSPFNSLTELHLLWFFQAVIRNSYSYEYFKKAIEETNISLDDMTDKSELNKIYSMFFNGVIGVDIGLKKPFDYLLNAFGTKLPLQIGVGLTHEAENNKLQSDLLRRRVKKLKQSIKADSQSKRLLRKLFEDPIRLKKITEQKNIEKIIIKDQS